MREEDVQSREGEMEKRENMLRKEVQDAREECMQKLGKQEAVRETTKLGKQENALRSLLKSRCLK